MKADTFFSPIDKENISKAVKEAEEKTSGELAVMVVDQSDSYPEGQILAGVIMGSIAAFILTDLFFNNNLSVFSVIAVILVIVCSFLSRFVPALIRFFTPSARLDQQVQKRALAAFYEKKLYKTRDDTGVLFFISLLEHKVWILADKGIYEKITQESLQSYAKGLALGIKHGTAADALCKAITNVGSTLAEHFPIKADDTNELSDEVIIG